MKVSTALMMLYLISSWVAQSTNETTAPRIFPTTKKWRDFTTFPTDSTSEQSTKISITTPILPQTTPTGFVTNVSTMSKAITMTTFWLPSSLTATSNQPKTTRFQGTSTTPSETKDEMKTTKTTKQWRFFTTLPDYTSHQTTKTFSSSTHQWPSPTYNPKSYCPSEFSCLNCTTIEICAPSEAGKLQVIDIFTCPSTTPWCDPESITCTSSEPPSCGSSSTGFSCLRNGFFLDPTNCSRYYECVDYQPLMYECASDTPYYAAHFQSCVSASYCEDYQTNCAGKSGVKLPVQGVNMFVYCVEGKPAVVDSCVGDNAFNSTSQLCEPSCPHAGLFPDQDDCTRFYRCSPASSSPSETRFDMTTGLVCPAGQAFSESEYQCVNRSLVATCDSPF